MSELVSETERRLLEWALRSYPSREGRAALRCALGDAASLLDSFATQIGNEGRRRDYIKKRAREDAALITRAANIVADMRDKITMPEPALLERQPETGGE